jgi:uncharacterized membrane protein
LNLGVGVEGHGINSRTVALTDGVVTIAMTLLVLDIRLPPSVTGRTVRWEDLLGIRGQFLSYGLSFVVVALLWLTHARKFRNLKRFSAGLFWLNILFLLAVGLVPFTTSLLAANGDAVATRVYAGVMAFASLMLSLMSIHTTTAGLAHAEGEKRPLRPASLLRFLSAAVFLGSIALSYWSVDKAKWFWLLLIPVAFIPDRWVEDA